VALAEGSLPRMPINRDSRICVYVCVNIY
jgi:hypothetical protein